MAFLKNKIWQHFLMATVGQWSYFLHLSMCLPGCYSPPILSHCLTHGHTSIASDDCFSPHLAHINSGRTKTGQEGHRGIPCPCPLSTLAYHAQTL